ncbi:MAG: DegV family protein, partial [Clostridia bacterium]|nr:DegV family protein [Clostridia bacterium]
MNWKIVVDSGCDLKSVDNLPANIAFDYIPLTLHVENTDYIDDADCDIPRMMEHMYAYKGKSSTACPSPEDWASRFRDCDCCIAISTSSGVSGTCNTARLGREMALEEDPNRRIFVVDSLSIGPEMTLLVEETIRFIQEGLSYEEVCKAIQKYNLRTKLCFMLSSVDNLVKNGRLNRLAGATVNVLGIRLVGIASEVGTLQLESKCRGFKKAAAEIMRIIKKDGFKGGKIIIGHVFNEIEAKVIASSILSEFPKCPLRIMKLGAICSFYAEKGGMIISYEG